MATLILGLMLGSAGGSAIGAGEPAATGQLGSADAEVATPARVNGAKKEKIAAVDLVLQGDAVCTRCHDEADDFPVLSIAQTKHGVSADKRTPTCVSCHGESSQHLRVPKGQQGVRPLPDFPFGKKTINDVAKHNQACISCHQGDKLTLWLGSAHSRRDVACVQCHKLHTGNDKVLSRATVPEVCMNCHTEKRAQINRPSRHPILEGKVVCTDCHAAHGSAGPKLMVKDSVVQTCYTCHMEKRGPFLWSHLPATQDCSICHNPHGSTVPNLLKLRPPFLCQQCHEPTSHRGNVPSLASTPGVSSPNASPAIPSTAGNAFGRGNQQPAQARACLNCHNNIHGGNNPINATNPNSSRTMRR